MKSSISLNLFIFFLSLRLGNIINVYHVQLYHNVYASYLFKFAMSDLKHNRMDTVKIIVYTNFLHSSNRKTIKKYTDSTSGLWSNTFVFHIFGIYYKLWSFVVKKTSNFLLLSSKIDLSVKFQCLIV